MQLVSVIFPPGCTRRRRTRGYCRRISSVPEIDAVTFASTWNTRLALLPLTVTPAAGPVIVCVPLVFAQLELACRPG